MNENLTDIFASRILQTPSFKRPSRYEDSVETFSEGTDYML